MQLPLLYGIQLNRGHVPYSLRKRCLEPYITYIVHTDTVCCTRRIVHDRVFAINYVYENSIFDVGMWRAHIHFLILRYLFSDMTFEVFVQSMYLCECAARVHVTHQIDANR